MQIEAVLFDLFDTLILLEKDDAFYMPSLKKLHEFLVEKEIDVPYDDFVRTYFDVRDRLYSYAAEKLEDPHFTIRISKTLQKFGYRFDVSDPTVVGAVEAFSNEFIKHVHPDGEAKRVLERLHGRYKLGIVSNLSIPECVSPLLRKFGLARFFDVVVISGAINKRKPSPEIFLRALTDLGVKPEKALFVGDTLGVDIKGAKDVGLRAVLIERQRSSGNVSLALPYRIPESDRMVKPDASIRSLKELLDIIEDC